MTIFAAAALLTVLPAAMAQTAPAAPAPAPTPAPAAPVASTARFNLDTPIETIVADAQAKAALEKTLPGIASHEHYEAFKAMSLRAVQPLSQGALTVEMLAKLEADLAAVK